MKMTTEQVWDFIIQNKIATEEECQLVTNKTETHKTTKSGFVNLFVVGLFISYDGIQIHLPFEEKVVPSTHIGHLYR